LAAASAADTLVCPVRIVRPGCTAFSELASTVNSTAGFEPAVDFGSSFEKFSIVRVNDILMLRDDQGSTRLSATHSLQVIQL
jgi:hypothetical protein